MNFLRRVYLTGATLVLPNEVVPEGSLLMEDGFIARIFPVSVAAAQTIDLKRLSSAPWPDRSSRRCH